MNSSLNVSNIKVILTLHFKITKHHLKPYFVAGINSFKSLNNYSPNSLQNKHNLNTNLVQFAPPLSLPLPAPIIYKFHLKIINIEILHTVLIIQPPMICKNMQTNYIPQFCPLNSKRAISDPI